MMTKRQNFWEGVNSTIVSFLYSLAKSLKYQLQYVHDKILFWMKRDLSTDIDINGIQNITCFKLKQCDWLRGVIQVNLPTRSKNLMFTDMYIIYLTQWYLVHHLKEDLFDVGCVFKPKVELATAYVSSS